MRQMAFSFMHKQRGPEKYSEEEYDQWVALYREGKSFREISELCEVPFATIAWRVRKKMGVTDGRKCGRKKKYEGLSNAEVQRQWQLKSNYGLSMEEYDAMVASQNGKCAICGREPKGGNTSQTRLNVDHSHVTGRVRGLLCSDCNHGIGKLGDDPVILDMAAAYIRRYRDPVPCVHLCRDKSGACFNCESGEAA